MPKTIWGFPKIRGAMLGVPYFRKLADKLASTLSCLWLWWASWKVPHVILQVRGASFWCNVVF